MSYPAQGGNQPPEANLGSPGDPACAAPARKKNKLQHPDGIETQEHTWVQSSITELKQKLNSDPDCAGLIQQSLMQAKLLGGDQLCSELFNALEWPTTIEQYLEYLGRFSRWIPHQSTDPAWVNPAKSGTHQQQGQQEVYDRLCHFYWLIDQEVKPETTGHGKGNKIVQNVPWFSDWLIAYANDWGGFLDTTDSFSDKVMQSFIDNSPKYAVEDSMIGNGPSKRPNNPSGWLTFNQFFARELNPGLRPISSPSENSVVTSPADCTFKQHFHIDADSNIKQICIKKTHTFANIKDLLAGSQYADSFANGTFAHYFLSPYSYHRFHTPVAGVLKECRAVHGKAYLDVHVKDGQFDAPDSSKDGYEFAQARGIVVIDTAKSPAGDIGLVAVIPIGMCHIASVQMIGQVGNVFQKGDEFGYFVFGGSDIILLFQDGVRPQLDTDGSTYHHYGTPVAKATPLAPGC